MLSNTLAQKVKFEIEVYGMESRLNEYSLYYSTAVVMAFLTVIALAVAVVATAEKAMEKRQIKIDRLARKAKLAQLAQDAENQRLAAANTEFDISGW